MSSYVNPSYVNQQASYTAQTAGVQPISAPYIPSACPTPAASTCGHKKHGYHRFNETGTILVLFILLVIISRAWLI